MNLTANGARALGVAALLAGGCGGATKTDPEPPAAPTVDIGQTRAAVVGQSIVLDVGASGGVAFAWELGDGRVVDGAQVEVAWPAPGTYAITLSVTGEDGATTSASGVVIVHWPLYDGALPASSSLAALDDSGAVVAVPEADMVSRVDANGVRWRRSVCAEPVAVAVREPHIYVACAGDDAVVRLAASDGVELARWRFADGARPVAVLATGDGVFVSLAAVNEVVSLGEEHDDSPGDEHADSPGDEHADSPGDEHVDSPGDEHVDSPGDEHAVATVAALSDPRALAALPAGPVVARFRSAPTHGQVLSPGGASWVVPFDQGPDSDVSNRGVPTLLGAAATAPDGRTVWLGGLLANVARGLYRDGQPLTFETTVRGLLVGLDATTGEERLRVRFDDQGRVGALAVTPLADRVLVGFEGSGLIVAIDAHNGRARGSIVGAGAGLTGLALTPGGDTLLVHAWLDRVVRAYDVRDWRSPALLWQQPTVDSEPLSADVLAGKRLFFATDDRRLSKDGYIACASCHPDGDQDGLTWDFTERGEGLRNTSSLLGRAGTGMGPLHWTGNFDEVHDFEHDLRGPFGGTGLLDDAAWALGTVSDPLGDPKAGLSPALDALDAYVSSLDQAPRSPYACPPGGEAQFAASGCPSCHSAPLFTDSSLSSIIRHDVGTLTSGSGARLGAPLDGLDTPTLLGVFATPPYLHDGSAATIAGAIAAHDALDVTSEELALLADYVRCL